MAGAAMAGTAGSCQRLPRAFHRNVRFFSQRILQPGKARASTVDFVSPADAPRERRRPFTDCVTSLAEASHENYRRLPADLVNKLDFIIPAGAARLFVPPLLPRCAADASGGSARLLWCGAGGTRSGGKEAGASGFRRWAEQRRVGGVWAEPRGMGAVWAEPRRYLHQITVEEEKPEHKYRVRAAVEGGFSFCSDLAPINALGGTAPTPMDYAAAAVAMCTATTVRLYADRKQWPLSHIAVTVEQTTPLPHGRLPDGLRLLLRLEGPLSTEQKERLLEIAGKCPVKQMMLGKMPQAIKTTLVDT
ncbi:unnamed protein product [Closterium sp. NIES-54]